MVFCVCREWGEGQFREEEAGRLGSEHGSYTAHLFLTPRKIRLRFVAPWKQMWRLIRSLRRAVPSSPRLFFFFPTFSFTRCFPGNALHCVLLKVICLQVFYKTGRWSFGNSQTRGHPVDRKAQTLFRFTPVGPLPFKSLLILQGGPSPASPTFRYRL